MPKFLRLYLPAMLLVGMVIACGSGTKPDPGYKTNDGGTGASEQKAEEEEFPDETGGQRNARHKAEEYLATGAFSKSGLIKQLEYEKFSTEDATYAVEALDVDWKDQAAKKAKEYMESGSFSRDGLKGQLTYEGFSAEEAEYGAAQTYDK
jgi:hypothetical protein